MAFIKWKKSFKVGEYTVELWESEIIFGYLFDGIMNFIKQEEDIFTTEFDEYYKAISVFELKALEKSMEMAAKSKDTDPRPFAKEILIKIENKLCENKDKKPYDEYELFPTGYFEKMRDDAAKKVHVLFKEMNSKADYGLLPKEVKTSWDTLLENSLREDYLESEDEACSFEEYYKLKSQQYVNPIYGDLPDSGDDTALDICLKESGILLFDFEQKLSGILGNRESRDVLTEARKEVAWRARYGEVKKALRAEIRNELLTEFFEFIKKFFEYTEYGLPKDYYNIDTYNTHNAFMLKCLEKPDSLLTKKRAIDIFTGFPFTAAEYECLLRAFGDSTNEITLIARYMGKENLLTSVKEDVLKKYSASLPLILLRNDDTAKEQIALLEQKRKFYGISSPCEKERDLQKKLDKWKEKDEKAAKREAEREAAAALSAQKAEEKELAKKAEAQKKAEEKAAAKAAAEEEARKKAAEKAAAKAAAEEEARKKAAEKAAAKATAEEEARKKAAERAVAAEIKRQQIKADNQVRLEKTKEAATKTGSWIKTVLLWLFTVSCVGSAFFEISYMSTNGVMHSFGNVIAMFYLAFIACPKLAEFRKKIPFYSKFKIPLTILVIIVFMGVWTSIF